MRARARGSLGLARALSKVLLPSCLGCSFGMRTVPAGKYPSRAAADQPPEDPFEPRPEVEQSAGANSTAEGASGASTPPSFLLNEALPSWSAFRRVPLDVPQEKKSAPSEAQRRGGR